MQGIYLKGLSRHSTVYEDTTRGELHLTLPERLPYEPTDDCWIHICHGDERLFDIAIAYFKDAYQDAVDLWETIAQFQEEPIQDPFVPLPEGKVLLIPSVNYIETTVFGEPLTQWPQL